MRRLSLLAAAATLFAGGSASADVPPPRPKPKPTTLSTKPSADVEAAAAPSAPGSTLLIGSALALAVASGGLVGVRRWSRSDAKS